MIRYYNKDHTKEDQNMRFLTGSTNGHGSDPRKSEHHIHKSKIIFGAVVLGLALVGGVWLGSQYQQRKQTEAANAAYRETLDTSTFKDSTNTLQDITTEVSPDTGNVYYRVNDVEAPGRPHFFANDHIRYDGVEYQRNTAVKTYLILGADTRGDLDDLEPGDPYAEDATDAIFLIAHNTAKDTVHVLQIPRDTMTLINTVDTKGRIDGQITDHISRAWAYGNGADFSGQLSMQAVSWLFAGLPIDGYLAGSMDLITSLNDFVGGVPVTVQDDFMTRADPGFVKGQTVSLQGDLAEKYVRYRDITEDFTAMTRMNRQRQYAIAFSDVLLAKQKKDNKTISNMFQLIQDHIQTNMDKGQYLKVALDMANSGPLEDQDFETIPGESRQGEEINPDTNQNQMYDQFYPDYKALDQLILADFYRTIS